VSMRDFRNRIVLVTGAASGIGFECSLAFARAGAQVVMTDINAVALAEARATVGAIGGSCLHRACDIADEREVQALADWVHAGIGPLDVLVNNAGIGYLGGFLETPVGAWQRVLDVNVMGVVHCTRAFLPRMLAAGGARAVVNLASAAGFAPPPTMAAYAASKHAVVGLSEVLAMELAQSAVRVLIVCPGVIDTPIVSRRSHVAAGVSDDQLGRLQRYYSANGCAPRVVADGIVKALGGTAPVLLIGPFARAGHTVMRISRRLARHVGLRSAREIGYL